MATSIVEGMTSCTVRFGQELSNFSLVEINRAAFVGCILPTRRTVGCRQRYATRWCPAQVLGIHGGRMGTALASGLLVVQLPDANVLHVK